MAHQWAAAPPVQKIIREIRAGKYGKLLRAYIRPKDDARGGGHELILHGTHHFTLLFTLAGWPRWVFGNVQVNGRDITRADRQTKPDFLGPIAGDSVSAVIGFDNGTRVFFDSTAGLAVEKEQAIHTSFRGNARVREEADPTPLAGRCVPIRRAYRAGRQPESEMGKAAGRRLAFHTRRRAQSPNRKQGLAARLQQHIGQ